MATDASLSTNNPINKCNSDEKDDTVNPISVFLKCDIDNTIERIMDKIDGDIECELCTGQNDHITQYLAHTNSYYFEDFKQILINAQNHLKNSQ